MTRTLAVMTALLLTGCSGYALIPAAAPVTIEKSLVVTPPNAWNKLSGEGPGKHADVWTLDGPALNELTFYAGIEESRPLIGDFDKRDSPLPRFTATMLPTDIAALFESTYRVAGGTALFEMHAIEPASFAGHPGFRFRYAYSLQEEEVRRDGEATGAVIGGRLYLIAFEAPTLHYFERDVAAYRAIVASARVVS